MLPVAGAFVLRGLKLRGPKKWPFSPMDGLVGGLILLICFSEYQNSGYNEAQNLMFDMFSAGFFPYMLGKGILDSPEMRVKFLRRFTGYLAIVVFFFFYEFRFWYNPYRVIFDPFFPGQGWITTERFGLARCAGPYSHALLAGAIFMIGAHFQVWLHRSDSWEPYFQRLRSKQFSKARIMSFFVGLGLLLTLARGPQIGAVIAFGFVWIGMGKQPAKRLLIAAVLVVVIGVPLVIQGISYASVGRANAADASQETAAYRKELLDHYVDVALQHALLGWGRNGWPKDAGMPSIDNYYLLLALMHGVLASGLFILILVLMMVRSLRDGLRKRRALGKLPSLSFTLAGIFAGLLFAWFTVFLGETAMPIVFLLIGFAERYLNDGGDGTLIAAEPAAKTAELKPQRFEVVLT